MIIPVSTPYTGVRYEDEAISYFNKLDTPITDTAKSQINDLIVGMKRLNIWNNCVNGWLFLPEHSGVSVGATTGTFYDLKGVTDLRMSGFATAGQTQTSKGPHIFVNSSRTLYSVLSGTMPSTGVFGDTNYGNGEDIGMVIGTYIDEPVIWTSETGAGDSVRPGFSVSIQQTGSYPTAAGNGQLLDISTGGAGNSIAPTPQYISRVFREQAPSTRGIRSGFIAAQNIIFERPLFFAVDPTSTIQGWNLTSTNASGGTSHGNTVSAYNYCNYTTLSRAGSATIPTPKAFSRANLPNATSESGWGSSWRPVYDPNNNSVIPFTAFVLDVGVPASITSNVLIICTDKTATATQNTNGGNPMFLFIFSKNTNFGFRSADNLVEFNMMLRKLCGPTHQLPMISPSDRGRMRVARNRTDTVIPPPLVYFGLSGTNGSEMLTLFSNNQVSANAGSLSAFNLELYCENNDYSLYPSTVTNMTSTNFVNFLRSFETRLHNGRNLDPVTMIFPLCSFTLGAGETVTRSIGGFITKTYRKLCTAMIAPTAATIVRNHSTAFATISNFEVLVSDFSFNYLP